MAWTYLLECRDGSFYVGSTVNLEKRIGEHQAGFGAQYTLHRLPVKLVWAGQFERVEDAYTFERQVQGWNRRKRIALIEERWSDLPALASRTRPRVAGSIGFETRPPSAGAPQPTGRGAAGDAS